MDFVSLVVVVGYTYLVYRIGKASAMREVGSTHIQDTLNKAAIPIGVLEKIDGKYYLYEKDTTNFLCQADKLEDIPLNLWDNKKISLAVILYPEEAADQTFWCINGKLKIVQ